MATRAREESSSEPSAERPARVVLVIDVGGTHVKMKLSNVPKVTKIDSGKNMTAARMVERARTAVANRRYDAVSVGYPGVVGGGKPLHEPFNLGPGWVGFDFEHAFGRPTLVINDAAMQAWGAYRGGRLLFLGLGTGLGAALIVDGVLVPMELAHLPYEKGKTYEEYVGKAGLKRLGKKKWRRHVTKIVERLRTALEVDDVVLGGGNAKRLHELPKGVRRGRNADAFAGGVRLWRNRPAAARAARAPT
jgi:polyphosphate glucokinase